MKLFGLTLTRHGGRVMVKVRVGVGVNVGVMVVVRFSDRLTESDSRLVLVKLLHHRATRIKAAPAPSVQLQGQIGTI